MKLMSDLQIVRMKDRKPLKFWKGMRLRMTCFLIRRITEVLTAMMLLVPIIKEGK